jgi:RND family efflux transporter MFP subunit
VQIDDRDYQAEAIVAESAFREAELRIAEEQARVSQAVRDWKRLGHNGDPSDLVLRKPQLAAAQAAVASAKAHLAMAHLNLERTQIKAPYAGRVMSKKVDVGQVVNVGTVLAEIYAVDYVEIRLPLTNQQVEFVDLPERYRNASNESGSDSENTANGISTSPKVILSARIGRQNYQWAGYIARTEGAIDVRSRQLFVVAQVNDPYGENQEGRPPLKIGQFVTAKINGKTLRDVYVIPRAALYQNNEIVLVKAQKISRQSVNVVWQSAAEVVIEGELDEGDLLATTPMNNVINGTDVEKVILGNKTEAAFSVAEPVSESVSEPIPTTTEP